MMRMAGFFPSVATQINFEMLFAPVDGQWRLFGLSVSLGQAAPVAPQAPQEPALGLRQAAVFPQPGCQGRPAAVPATAAPPKPAPAKPPDP